MFQEKMKAKEKVTLGVSGPKVEPEEVLTEMSTPLRHGNGCIGHMTLYYDITSGEVRAKCSLCGAAYMVAKEVDGSFKRFRE